MPRQQGFCPPLVVGDQRPGDRPDRPVYSEAEELCTQYASAKGVGAKVKPERLLFFRKLGPILSRTLEKCERENGFM